MSGGVLQYAAGQLIGCLMSVRRLVDEESVHRGNSNSGLYRGGVIVWTWVRQHEDSPPGKGTDRGKASPYFSPGLVTINQSSLQTGSRQETKFKVMQSVTPQDGLAKRQRGTESEKQEDR